MNVMISCCAHPRGGGGGGWGGGEGKSKRAEKYIWNEEK